MADNTSASAPPGGCAMVGGVSGGHCVGAAVRVGSNSLTGEPEAVVGANLDSDRASSHGVWDADLSDGFDSGWKSAQLTAEAGGGAAGVKWSVVIGSTATLATYTGVTYGFIRKVQISASASGGGRKMSWDAITVAFYRDGVLNQSITLGAECTPVADTTGGSSSSTATQVVEVVPTADDNTKVVVTALARLQSSGTNLPGADEISGGIYVFAADCASTSAGIAGVVGGDAASDARPSPSGPPPTTAPRTP